MAARKPLFLGTEGFSEEMATTDSMTLGGLTMGGNIDMNSAGKVVGSNPATTDGDLLAYGQSGANLAGLDVDTSPITMNSQKITGLANGASASQDAATVAQMEAAILTGNVFKEPVFSESQLVDGASGGIAALGALHFDAQPIATDFITFYDGTNTRTYTFVANQGAESAATDVSIESDAATAMQRLVTRMNADATNTWWTAEYHAPGEFGGADGEVHIIEEKTPVDTLSTSRIYGTWGTQANFKVVTFSDGATAAQYNDGTEITAPTADPTSGRFGLGRAEATLVDGEVHLALDINAQFSWEDSAQQWNQISGVGAIPDATSAAGGGVKGVVTFDSDKGLDVAAGVAEVDIDEVTLDFTAGTIGVTGLPSLFEINGTPVGATVDAAALDTLTDGSNADGEHVHAAAGITLAHSDLTGVSSDQHHNQVHAIDGADHSLAGATTGDVLTATSATTFAFQAPGAASEVPKVEDTLTTATDTVAVADPVYINGNNTVGKADAAVDAKSRIRGIIRSGAGAAPQSVEVVSLGPAAGILTGATFNTPYYLQATGGIGTALPGAGNRVIQIGKAINATDLFVDIIDYGKKAA